MLFMHANQICRLSNIVALIFVSLLLLRLSIHKIMPTSLFAILNLIIRSLVECSLGSSRVAWLYLAVIWP